MIPCKKIILIVFFIFLILFLIVNLKAELIINDFSFKVDLALLSSEKNRGLRGTDSLKEDQGMLFFYFNDDIRYFWMKDMNFPIDVLWIKDNKVVNISENVSISENEITKMNSVYPADKVLELKAGTILKHNIKINDKVVITRYFLIDL